jgi:hypothetical protein
MSLTEPDPPAASSGLKGSIYDTIRATSAEVCEILDVRCNLVNDTLDHVQVECRLPELKNASSDLVRFLLSFCY